MTCCVISEMKHVYAVLYLWLQILEKLFCASLGKRYSIAREEPLFLLWTSCWVAWHLMATGVIIVEETKTTAHYPVFIAAMQPRWSEKSANVARGDGNVGSMSMSDTSGRRALGKWNTFGLISLVIRVSGFLGLLWFTNVFGISDVLCSVSLG